VFQPVRALVLCLRCPGFVSPMSTPFTYDEPTVIWRMRRGQSASTHAVIGPEGAGAWVMWFVNGRPMGVRDFVDWAGAMRWCEQLRIQNWAVGWRSDPDHDDARPPRSMS
jgi:hypothetical protein